MSPRQCLLCGCPVHTYARPPEGDLLRCGTCGFMFYDPAQGSHDPVRTFSAAYAGVERRAGMEDFSFKMLLRLDAEGAGIPPSRMLTSAHQDALAFICRNVPRGSPVLDIGCGPGHFVRAVKEAGYDAYGLDVAEPVVALLRQGGLPVWHGTIDTVPAGWVDPVVCTTFFVLHHVPDPVAFLRAIRDRFPRATLIVAVHNDLDRGIPPLVDRRLPPRTYSLWAPAHLRLAMAAAGYHARVYRVAPRPRDGTAPVPKRPYLWLRRRWPSGARAFLRLHYHTLPLWGACRVTWDHWIRGFATPAVAVGVPARTPADRSGMPPRRVPASRPYAPSGGAIGRGGMPRSRAE